MPAKSKERLHQLFVQHTHSNCPKQGCKGRVQAVWSAWSRSDRRRGFGVVLSVEVTPGSPAASCASDNRLALVVAYSNASREGAPAEVVDIDAHSDPTLAPKMPMVLVPPGGALVMAEKTLFQGTPNSSKIRSRTFWRSLSGRLPVPSSRRCELRAILAAGERRIT